MLHYQRQVGFIKRGKHYLPLMFQANNSVTFHQKALCDLVGIFEYVTVITIITHQPHPYKIREAAGDVRSAEQRRNLPLFLE